jgi:hypothetical protein
VSKLFHKSNLPGAITWWILSFNSPGAQEKLIKSALDPGEIRRFWPRILAGLLVVISIAASIDSQARDRAVATTALSDIAPPAR